MHYQAVFAHIHHLVGDGEESDFGDLGLIFKFKGGLRMSENALSAFYLLKGWMNLKQPCSDIYLGKA